MNYNLFPGKGIGMDQFRKIFMFPWLAFGHVLPFLQVANKLSDRGFYIYLCSTPVNLDSIKKKISEKYCRRIKLVELHMPDFPELPPSLHTTNGLPPRLMPKLKTALYRAKPVLSEILSSLKPDVVMYDSHQPWTEAVASRHNIPAVSFGTVNALTISYVLHMTLRPGVEYPYPSFQFSDIEKTRILQNVERVQPPPELEDDEDLKALGCSNGILIIRSSREMEGKYVEYISILSGLKVIPVCPILNQLDHHNELLEDDEDDQEIMIQWLGDKNDRSTVYVSFGSECFLNKQEVEEIAFGLELSKVNFIWVLRFPKGEERPIQEAVPEGEEFLQRVKGRGRIMSGWAPQSKILGHPSIAGFVSHCGWSSVIESIQNGVPIIAIPLNLDQPFNARLMVETGVGTEVKRDHTKGTLDREDIAKRIRDVVIGETGQNLRTKTSCLCQKLKAREEEEIDGLVNILNHLSDSPPLTCHHY